ncbi:MAG: hypothetical protein HUJ69_03720 [Lachnospiraceae bacterium]|nr:hypothetical protein [Lachnospiraceae bacterium]
MKKSLSVILAALMVISMFAFTGCGAEKLNFGVGFSNTISGSDADGETNGKGQTNVNVAAVLVDKNGKIVKVALDCYQGKVEYTSAGVAVATQQFKTKYELKEEYGMGGRSEVGEWYEQIDALCGVVIGKTADEVMALIGEGHGTEEVQTAGCTITVTELLEAVANAVKAAAPSEATKDSNLNLGFSVSQSLTDATEEKNGNNQLDVTFAAVASANGKVQAIYTDCIQAKFTFDTAGKTLVDPAAAFLTKRELGNDYGMSKIGAKEWFEQADAFEGTCVGKTAAEITAFQGADGTVAEEVVTAGCTIHVNALVEAVAKAVQ